jgi:hypothetical protein
VTGTRSRPDHEARALQQSADKTHTDLATPGVAAAQVEAQFGATQRLLQQTETRLTREEQSHQATRELLAAALAKACTGTSKPAVSGRRKPKPA